MKAWTIYIFASAPLFMACTSVFAQNPDPQDIRACTAMESDAQRLACYDRATGRNQLPAAQKRNASETTPAKTPNVFSHERTTNSAGNETAAVSAPLSLLDTRWELSPESKLGTFNLRGYKPIYVMPVFATSNQNQQPYSPNPANRVETSQDLQNIEAKFQLSLKTKIWQGVFGDVGDLWVGYTQSSLWQVYNAKESRPFRETDYEPEAMLIFNTNYQLFGWDGRLLGIGVDHQSNGQSDPLSAQLESCDGANRLRTRWLDGYCSTVVAYSRAACRR